MPESLKAEVLAWLATKPNAEQIAERLTAAEFEAYLWHVISVIGQVSEKDLAHVERLANQLLAGGYRK